MLVISASVDDAVSSSDEVVESFAALVLPSSSAVVVVDSVVPSSRVVDDGGSVVEFSCAVDGSDDGSDDDCGVDAFSVVDSIEVVEESSSSDLVTFLPGCSQVPNLSFLFSFVHCLLQQAASTRHSAPSGKQTHPRVVQLKEQQ